MLRLAKLLKKPPFRVASSALFGIINPRLKGDDCKSSPADASLWTYLEERGKGKPGVVGGGTKKFYASAVSGGELTLAKLTANIGKISTVSGADIRAVLYAMVDVMKMSLADGQIVRLGELGSLRISIASNGEDTADEVLAKSIKSARTVFTPGMDLKNELKNLKFVKA